MPFLTRLLTALRHRGLRRRIGIAPQRCRECDRLIFSAIRTAAERCVDCQGAVERERFEAYRGRTPPPR